MSNPAADDTNGGNTPDTDRSSDALEAFLPALVATPAELEADRATMRDIFRTATAAV